MTLQADDTHGNTNSCTATVTVVDTTPPTIACPASLTVTGILGALSVAVEFDTAVASDNCGIATNFCKPASGSSFPNGTNRVVATAVDTAGNTNTCSFTVTVNPPAGPDLTAAALPAPGSNGWEAAVSGAFVHPVTHRLVSMILGVFDEANLGVERANASVTQFYLSDTPEFNPETAVLLTAATRTVRALAAGQTQTLLFGVYCPTSAVSAAGKYLVAVVDATGVVAEANEWNNVLIYGPLEELSRSAAQAKLNKQRRQVRQAVQQQARAARIAKAKGAAQ